MEISNEQLREIAIRNQVSFVLVKKFYDILLQYPFVERGTEEQFLECIETIVQDRISEDLINKTEHVWKKTIDHSINDALVRIYGVDITLPYLSKDYKVFNRSRIM